MCDRKYGVRPAFYLNLNSVLFSSAAAGGKSSGAAGAAALNSIGTNTGNEWKLTLKDSSRSGFFARTMSYNSGVLEFCYRDAKTGANEFVSVIVTDNSGNTIKQYGRVVSNSASGTTTVNLSGKLGTNDRVFAFSEQYNGANNTDFASELRELSLTSPFAPSITTTSLPNGTEGEAYSATLAAGGTTPITLTVSNLPAGLSFNPSTREISGTPTENGTFTLVVTATNNPTGNDTIQLSLQIAPVAPNVTVDPATLDFGSAQEGYAAITDRPVTVSNTGGGSVTVNSVSLSSTDFNYTLVGGVTLPKTWTGTFDDLTIGVSPKVGLAPGSYNETMTIAYNDGTDKTEKVTLTFTVTGTSITAPSVTTPTLPSGGVGTAYTAMLSAKGTAPFTWSATGLPAGLSINSSTGEISGTPTESGTFTVNVTATNSAGNDTKTLTLNIVPASAPVPTPAPTPVPHSHQYEWVTLREADEHNDGEMVYRCRDCGDVLYSVPMTAYYVFNRNTAEKIRKAEQGATLLIETRRWISFHKMVMQALADRPDVTLQVRFLDGEYRGNLMTFTIPAGTDTLSLTNEEGYCGFLYLGGIFGLHPAEGN
ncbi:MAG: putative Ig domain-containing protein [Lachnospiraceae bacterium]|nr:putative Ig domain-containing protein [Lachnospiraceae bacterium]